MESVIFKLVTADRPRWSKSVMFRLKNWISVNKLTDLLDNN